MNKHKHIVTELINFHVLALTTTYSTINVVWPTLKQAITLSERSFWLFEPHTFFHIPQGHCPLVKKKFVDFFWKIYKRKMKNPWKSRHQLFRVHRVYGIQNDRLDLTVNEFFTVWKTMLRSQRYSQKCKMKKHEKTQRFENISG